MRIMFVSSETPLFPAGGIATYLEYMLPALQEQGHDVFLFTFRNVKDRNKELVFDKIPSDHVHIEWVADDQVHAMFPSRSHDQSVSFYMANRLERAIDEWSIDVVESTDWQAPCLGLYQRQQMKDTASQTLFSVYNHGVSEFIWEADQLPTPDWGLANQMAERQQLRTADVVVAPSRFSKDRLKTIGIETDAHVVREPYIFSDQPVEIQKVQNEIQYMGRLSIGKGIDKLILAANVMHSVEKLRRIEIIGRVTFTTFREPDILKYATSRLHPELRDRLFYSDYRPREVVMDQLRAGTMSPHLGSHETFSYACAEAIDRGQVPIVRHGTPMAEFFPEDLQGYILDEQMRSVSELQSQFARILSDGPAMMKDIQTHCRATLAPAKVANDLADTYAEALDRKRGWKVHAVPRQHATIADLTVLIPAYKPNHEFMETIDSIAAQTAGIANVLICDDGTPETHQPWFDYALAVLPNCKIIRQPNTGLLAARNTLIEACETELSIFVDTDDLFAPTLIENMLCAWNQSPKQPDAIIPQRRNFGETDELILRHPLGDYMHILENDYRMTALIRTDILREIGFDTTRRNGEGDDWIFWIDFDGRGYKGVLLPEAGFLYRFRKGSMSWPWSDGQHVGTHTMLLNVLSEISAKNPAKSAAIARALYTKNIAKV